jgi:methyl-accepting chemotaxis protein
LIRFLPRLRLTHRFAALIVTFAVLTAVSANILWQQVVILRTARVDIIRRQYPARLAIVEAKASEAGFSTFALQLLHADKVEAHNLGVAIEEEAKRFRNWMATARSLMPESQQDIAGIDERFDRMADFLAAFAKMQPGGEPREAQIEYRFGPLRDDLEAALNHLSNNINVRVQDRIDYVDDVVSHKFQMSSAAFAIGYVVFFTGVLVWAALAIARPMLKLAESMRDIAAGHFNFKIAYTGRADEVG